MSSHAHVIAPQAEHTHTVIFLHGRDSSNIEFADEFFESEASGPLDSPRTLPDLFPTIRWVFPAAQLLYSQRFDVTISQWFDMWSVENREEQPDLQIKGLKQSIGTISKVIEDEKALLPQQKIFLCGISQGFATALSTFIAGEHTGSFAGLIGLCSWIPFAEQLKQSKSRSDALHHYQSILFPEQELESLKKPSMELTPVFLGHASDDEVVPVANGKKMRDLLTQTFDLSVRFFEYTDGGHWINEPQGVDDIVRFLKSRMKATESDVAMQDSQY